ncbi:hypothetical protein ACJX0J_021188, partial [Zea mays]
KGFTHDVGLTKRKHTTYVIYYQFKGIAYMATSTIQEDAPKMGGGFTAVHANNHGF